MGTFTAKLAIDRKLRKELMENYDLIEVVNKGRYYTAKAYSKSDKKALFQELTIEKFPLCVKEKGTTTYVEISWICGGFGSILPEICNLAITCIKRIPQQYML